jgi:hypothetical protein
MRAVVAFLFLSSPVFAGNFSSEIIYDSPCDTPTMTFEQYAPLVHDADPVLLYAMYRGSVEALGCEPPGSYIKEALIPNISDERKLDFVFGGADYVPVQVPVPMAFFNLLLGVVVLWRKALLKKLGLCRVI